MNLALWILAALLGALFLASGSSKILLPHEKLITSGYQWVEDFSTAQVKLIGGAEALGAIGLVLPAALGVIEVLTPVAAAGLALLMGSAAFVHVRRHETEHVVKPFVLAALAASLAVLRFGPYNF